MVTNPSTGSNIQFQPIRQAQSNPYGSYSSTSTLYGVGLNYQLCELQHLYRHPRKIYELALTLVGHNNNQTSSLSSTSNTIPNNYGKQSTSQQTVSSTNKMNQLNKILEYIHVHVYSAYRMSEIIEEYGRNCQWCF